MKCFMTFATLFLGFCTAVSAETIHYDLVEDESKIGFNYTFSNNKSVGSFQNYTIDLVIDFDEVANSHVAVTLNTRTAKAGFVFATQAMLSPSVLDAQTYPSIKFISKNISTKGQAVLIDGLVTVRGITKPLRLNAQLFRKQGSEIGERENLRIKISGALNRHNFGASGYPDSVGDTLGINIDAAIKRK